MRIVIEEPCEHGEMPGHKIGPPVYVNPINIQERPDCPGGSRRILPPTPTEHAVLAWIEEPYETVDGTIMPLSVIQIVRLGGKL